MACTALFTLISVSCTNQAAPSQAAPTIVNTSRVLSASADHSLTLSGVVTARQEMQIAFRVSGTIERINVSEGQHVGRGQIVAVMDPRDYAEQLRATEAEHAQIKASAGRVIDLFNDEATTADNYDRARYGLQQIDSKLKHHADQLADTRLSSPVDGYVQEIIFHDGETVGAGMGVMTIVADGPRQVEVSLPAKVMAEKNHFGAVYARVQGVDHPVRISLAGIRQKATAAQLYTAMFNLPATVSPPIGSSCSVVIDLTTSQGDASDGALSVPASALVKRDAATGVYVCRDSVASWIPVKVVSIDRSGRARVDGRLSPGEVIVVSGTSKIKPGEKVAPVDAAEAVEKKGGLL